MRTAALLAALAALASGCGRGPLESPDPAVRAAAVRALAGGARDLPALLVAQRDASAEVRRAAAEVLAARGGPQAAEALGPLLRDPDPSVAAVAAAGLGRLAGVPRARADLLAAYGSGGPEARAAIAGALDALGVSLREAVEVEARALWERNLAALGANQGPARAGAAEELGASARAEAVEKLLPLVDPNRNPAPALAAAAARGLAEAGDFRARPYLEALLDAGVADLAEAAASALGRLGDPAAADALARAAIAGGRGGGAAADGLAALPAAPEVGAALCEVAARTADPRAAGRAAREARIRDESCPERPVLARLGGPAALAALAALAELGLEGGASAAAVARVAPLLAPGRGDAATRAAAARALGGLGGEAAGRAVMARAQAIAARRGAARLSTVPAALPAVAPGAGAQSPGDDALELGALLAAAGRLKAEGAAPLLVAHAGDPAVDVRAGAVEGLGALGAPSAAGPLAAALSDPELRVQVAAAGALARLGAAGRATAGPGR